MNALRTTSSTAVVTAIALSLASGPVYANNHGWTIKIDAGISPVMSTITLGEFSDADDAFDTQYDAPAFPTTTDVNAYFEHPEWGQAETQFVYDIRESARLHVWDFRVDYNQKFKLQEFMVAWDLSHEDLPATMQLTLTDVTTGEEVDMREVSSYGYNTGWITVPQSRYFRVTAEYLQPPVLTVDGPADGAIFADGNIVVSGTATDEGHGDEGIQSVMINGIPADNGFASGNDTTNWSLSMALAPGENILNIVATDGSAYNDATVKVITVTYYPPTDTDGDGLLDEWETQKFGSLSVAGATTDTDGDGLLDGIEYTRGTNPNSADTDGDGDSDGDEARYGSNPTDATDTLDDHRPNTPVIRAIAGEVPLDHYVFDVEGFSSPDAAQGDYLAASEWDISLANDFAADKIAMHKLIERKPDAANDATDHRRLAVTYGTMKKATSYWVRTRHRGRTGLYSDWSNAVAFNTVSTDPFDLDGDGNDDRYHVIGADTNRNGVDDATEGVRAILDASKAHTIGVVASSGSIVDLSVMSSTSLPADQVPDDQLPYEFFSFRVEGLPVDALSPASVTVTFHFPETLGPAMTWYKYDPATELLTDYTSNVEFGSMHATVTLVDGGAGDADGVVNGAIVDPSGPGLPAASSSGSSVSVDSTTTTTATPASSGGVLDPLALIALLPFATALRRRR